MNTALLKIRSDILRKIKEGKKTVEFRKLNKDYIQVGYRVVLYPYDTPAESVQIVITDKRYVKPERASIIADDKETRDFIVENYNEELFLVAFSFKILPLTKGQV